MQDGGGGRLVFLSYFKAGSVSDETVCLSDLLSTCAEIVGNDLPDDAAEDSVSNLPAWKGKAMDRTLRETTVHHSIDGSFSIRKENWKLEFCPGSGGWSYPKKGRDDFSDLPPMQMYDLSEDVR